MALRVARILNDVRSCSREGWAEDPSRTLPGYAVFRDDWQATSIAINTYQTDKNEYVVPFILFLRVR